MAEHDGWPALPHDGWRETRATLHLWTQIVGKMRLARLSRLNEWWAAALFVSSRGLTTKPMAFGDRHFELTFDLVEHVLRVQTSTGGERAVPLAARSAAEFTGELARAMGALGLVTPGGPRESHASVARLDASPRDYDPEAASRFWRALLSTASTLEEFRGRYVGKASPVHFLWGSFELAATRFSGRQAFPDPADPPAFGMCAHECQGAGWWPDDAPAYHAFAWPDPDGFSRAYVAPGATWDPERKEFVLPYEAVRTSRRPRETLLGFLQSTYEAAADRGGWDRATLDREPELATV